MKMKRKAIASTLSLLAFRDKVQEALDEGWVPVPASVVISSPAAGNIYAFIIVEKPDEN